MIDNHTVCTVNLQDICVTQLGEKCFVVELTLIVERNFSLVTSINVRQSSELAWTLLILLVALSITISMPLNEFWTVWLNFSKSSLFKMSQWRTEIPAEFTGIDSDCAAADVFPPLHALFPFTKITWQLCFLDNCSANSCDSFVSPFVIWKNSEKWSQITPNKAGA